MIWSNWKSAEKRAILISRYQKRLLSIVKKRHSNSRMICIAGMQRSGTTLVMNVFHLCPDIDVFDETGNSVVYSDYRLRNLEIAGQQVLHLIDDDEDLALGGIRQLDRLEFLGFDRRLVVRDEQPRITDDKGQLRRTDGLQPIKAAAFSRLDKRIALLIGESQDTLIEGNQPGVIHFQLPETRRFNNHRESPMTKS